MSTRSVAVVITVKNEAFSLPDLLTAFEQQTQLPDEVIITVAESSDRTLEIARQWKPVNIQLQVEERKHLTRSQGRNLGVRLANCEIIVFTDAGCQPEQTWLEELVHPFHKKGIELVSGLTWVKANNAWEEAQAPFVLIPPTQIETNPLPATRNMAILKKSFLKFGGFQPNLNFAEDFEFARRLRSKNILAEFVPSAVVWWQPRTSFQDFFIMIQRLTIGDMQAHTWRLGHFSMVFRYVVFVLLPFFFALWLSPFESLVLSISIYFFYLFVKTIRFSFLNWKSYLWAPLLQLLTDIAVLTGMTQLLLVKKQKESTLIHE